MKAKEKILFFNAIAKINTTGGNVLVDKFCNGFTVVNIGGSIATVNGWQLSPPAAGETLGDSFTFGGNKGEIYRGRIDITFAAAVNPAVLITQKVYMNMEDDYVDRELNPE
jgi:hypothetical protein